jgi:hypothetical protein
MPIVLPMRGPDSNNLYQDQRVRVQIGNQYYAFRYRYNSFEDAWYCYVGLLGQDPRVKFKIVNGIDLLVPYKAYDEVPKGLLKVIDMDDQWGRPSKEGTFRDGRFFLIFVSEDEDINAWAESVGDAV